VHSVHSSSYSYLTIPASDSQIADQIKVINRDYAGTGIAWKLANTDRTLNESWFYNASPKSYVPYHMSSVHDAHLTALRPALLTAMKHKLRKGGAGDLNLYTVAYVPG
jgi:hypothetical protein